MDNDVMNDIRTKIGEGGRVIIPSVFRQQLHLNIGDEVILHIKDEEIYMTTPLQALRKLQARVKGYMDTTDKPISLVDELIALRRTETEEEHE
jgi:AbrB family looped-hinge helix DNA binding protein